MFLWCFAAVLNMQVDINETDEYGFTALHMASENGHLKVIGGSCAGFHTFCSDCGGTVGSRGKVGPTGVWQLPASPAHGHQQGALPACSISRADSYLHVSHLSKIGLVGVWPPTFNKPFNCLRGPRPFIFLLTSLTQNHTAIAKLLIEKGAKLDEKSYVSTIVEMVM